MRYLILLMCVIATAMTSCERPTYEHTGTGAVWYKYLKKGDKKLVGLCFRKEKNGQLVETEEILRPECVEISRLEGSSLSNGYFITTYENEEGLYYSRVTNFTNNISERFKCFINENGAWEFDLDSSPWGWFRNRVKKETIKFLGKMPYGKGVGFYPGDWFEMEMLNGKKLYWFDHEFTCWGVDLLVPGANCYFTENNGLLEVTRCRVSDDPYVSKRYLTFKPKLLSEISNGNFDKVFEIVNIESPREAYFLALKYGKSVVFNIEGKVVTKYPQIINKRLLKTKINNTPDWTGYLDGVGFPKRFGTEKAGTIVVKVPHQRWF